MAVAAFQAPAAAPAAALAVTKIEKVKDNLYVITGSSPTPRETFSGGNTGVFVTDAGVVVVDTKLAGWGPTILERIRTVTDKPVTTIINTHTHGDHTGSNEFFGATVESVVQENTKANMERMDAFKGDKAEFLPKRTYKDKLTLGAGKDAIDLYYFGPGHTNGDTFVVFRRCGRCTRATCFRGRTRRSSIAATAAAASSGRRRLSKVLTNVKNVDTVIGGHQPVAHVEGSADVPAVHRRAAGRRRKRRTKAGKSVDDAAAASWIEQVSRLRTDAPEGRRSGHLRRAERQVTR